MGRKKSRQQDRHRQPARGTPPRNPRRRERLAGRMRPLLGTLAIAVVVVGGVLAAARLPMTGDPTVDLDVTSEAVRLVPKEDLDLADLARQASGPGSPASSGIRLRDRWIYVRGVDVRVPALGGGHFHVSEDRTIPAAVLKQLYVSSGCVVNLDGLGDGGLRVGVTPATADGGCRLRAEAWTGAAELTDSLLDAPREPRVPAMELVVLTASPTTSRPVSLKLFPADSLHLARIPVSGLSFETLERSPYPESAILEGTVAFAGVSRVEQVMVRETLGLSRVDGDIVELSVGGTLHTRYKGKSSAPRISSRGPFAPTLLEQLKLSEVVIALTILTGLIPLVLQLFQLSRDP